MANKHTLKDFILNEMPGATLPHAATSDTLAGVQANKDLSRGEDTKEANKRNAPRRKRLRKADDDYANKLMRYVSRAEEEEDDLDLDSELDDAVLDIDDEDFEEDEFDDEDMDFSDSDEEDDDDEYDTDDDDDIDYDLDGRDGDVDDFDSIDDILSRISDDGIADDDDFEDFDGDDDDEDFEDDDGDFPDDFDDDSFGDDVEIEDFEDEDMVDFDDDYEEEEEDYDEDKFNLDIEDDEDDEDDDDLDDLRFNDDEWEPRDRLDHEEDDDDFGDIANDMVGSLSVDDEVIDDVDDNFGTLTKWWRERVVQPVTDFEGGDFEGGDFGDEDDFEASDNDYEEENDWDAEDDREYEEEQEAGQMQQPGSMAVTAPPKIDQARMMFQQLVQRPDMTRSDIIASFVEEIGVTQSTAVSYYERLAKEAGLTGDDDDAMTGAGGAEGTADMSQGMQGDTDQAMDIPEPEPEIPEGGFTTDDPNRQGIIRTVDRAHLVYKRQNDEGTYDELWTYNIDSGMKDEIKIRRAILAGTDIPQGRTRSEDGSQRYELETLGNAQILHITGMPN